MADDFKPFSFDDFQPVDLDSLILTEADIEAMILKPADYSELVRKKKRGARAKSNDAETLRAANGRKRRYRARQRNGKIVLTLEASGFELVTALIEAGYVTEAESLDRRKVEGAAAAVLDRWAKHWLEHGN